VANELEIARSEMIMRDEEFRRQMDEQMKKLHEKEMEVMK